MYFLPVLLFGSEIWDMTVRSSMRLESRRVLWVVPSTHSTSPIHCSCHQPGSLPLLCATSCHPDSGMLRASGVSHIDRSDSDEDNTLASMTRRRSGNDLVVGLVKLGCASSRMTSNNRTWAFGRHCDQWREIGSAEKCWTWKWRTWKWQTKWQDTKLQDTEEHDMKLAQKRQTFEAE